ncbi:hypothetical protein MVES_002239 [Malassezia vespertilionis]|uniref:Uncharacterized protein n=2 Tax=Malassezia vespertilionis TaxID=2020962 RepID=A0A2N1JCE6_9BASI|nr:hypothetical protein MVES_002239 [Malassezia vespertilionis]
MAKQLSSRVQGLKFMQRGAARTSSPPSAAACEEDRSVCQETADPAQEQWVLPTQFRACTNTTALPKNDWNAWLFDAYEEKPKALNRRRTFGNVASADSVRKSAD